MKVEFSSGSWAECRAVHEAGGKLFAKTNALIEERRRHPFTGTGKPEPLGGTLSGWWSRWISHAHRLVYRVAGSGDEQRLQVAQCRYHY